MWARLPVEEGFQKCAKSGFKGSWSWRMKTERESKTATPSSYSGSCNEMKTHNSNKLTNKKKKGVDVYGWMILNVIVCQWIEMRFQFYWSASRILPKLIRQKKSWGTCWSPYIGLHYALNELHFHSSAWKTLLQCILKDHTAIHMNVYKAQSYYSC